MPSTQGLGTEAQTAAYKTVGGCPAVAGALIKQSLASFQAQMMLFQHLCLMLLFAVTDAAFCSITNNVSFTLTTFNATDAALNNTLVDISACGTVGLKQPSATGGALVAHFSNGGIWRYNGGGDKEPGFLTKRPGGGYFFKFSKTPPADAVLRTFEIGCDYSGHHFLGIKGYDWQACKQPNGGYAVCNPSSHAGELDQARCEHAY
jgi:hypothetical protein